MDETFWHIKRVASFNLDRCAPLCAFQVLLLETFGGEKRAICFPDVGGAGMLQLQLAEVASAWYPAVHAGKRIVEWDAEGPILVTDKLRHQNVVHIGVWL